METVLITGGTGMVGGALAKMLLHKGYQVIILSRNITGKPQSGQLRYARWNVKKQEIDLDAVQAADHIIHLAGASVVAKKWTASYKKEIVSSRTESSRLIFDALAKNPNKVQTVVSASAAGWYGPDKDDGKAFVETDPPYRDFLGETCKLWEESIEPVANLGKRLVKMRIGIVMSNEGGALAEFKKPLRFGIAAILGSGAQVISWIHIEDLCRMFVVAIENKEMHGVYNAVADVPVTNKTLTLSLAKAVKGNWYLPVHVPAFVIKTMLGDRSIEVMKSASISNRKILETGFETRFKTIDEAMGDLAKK
jgi:uncharacterized protein